MASLASVCDGHGALYEVGPGWVATRLPATGPGAERAFAAGGWGRQRWAATEKHLTINFGDGTLADRPLDGLPVYGSLLPAWPETFAVAGPAERMVAVRAKGEYRCAGIRGNDVDAFVVKTGAILHSGWAAGSAFHLVGELPRPGGNAPAWARPVVITVEGNAAARNFRENSRELPRVEREMAKRMKSNVAIHAESFVASAVRGDEAVLVCACVAGEPDADREWLFSDQPAWTDYHLYGLVRFSPDGSTELLEAMRGVVYCGEASVRDAHFFYFLPSTKLSSAEAAVTRISIPRNGGALRSEHGHLTRLPGRELAYLRVYWSEELGFHACAGAYTETGYAYSLLASKDGLDWHEVQKLSHYAR